jgi:hypothetical protein
MIEKLFAAAGLAVCLVLLLRLLLKPAQRQRFDAAMHRAWARCRQLVRRRPRPAMSQQDAARVAEEAIRRAREGRDGQWEGNVFRPRSFRRPKKPH